MVPAVEDFQQKQELLERSAKTALSSFSSDDEDDVHMFKGDRLMTAEQLRQQLEVRSRRHGADAELVPEHQWRMQCALDSRAESAITQRHEYRHALAPTLDVIFIPLQGISDEPVLCVMVIDVLDASGSFLNRIRNLVGRNPIIVIATKLDLLPKGTNEVAVRAWLHDLVKFKKLNCLSTHLISNKNGAICSSTACRWKRSCIHTCEWQLTGHALSQSELR